MTENRYPWQDFQLTDEEIRQHNQQYEKPKGSKMSDKTKPMDEGLKKIYEEEDFNPAKDNWSNMATFGCGTCMYFVPKGKQAPERSAITMGRCRRHAPEVQQGWPTVYGTDWCGDHKIGLEH